MPIPKPQGDETQNEFVSRCVSAIADEYDDNDQRVAICISTFEKEQNMKAIKASRSFRDEFMKHIPSNKSIK